MLPAISVAAVLISAPPRVHAAETEQQVVPPPVPFYASHVNKTALLAPGIVVIDTDDSFDTVLSWYRANLKDRTADVTLGPQHQHFLTHTGAGVDISATGGGRRKTKISLLWKPTGSGGYAALPAEKPEQKPASAPAPAPAPEENVLQTFPAAEPPVAEEPVPTKIALEALQPKVSIEPARGQIALPRLRTRVVAVPPIPAPPAGEASVPRRETRGAESPGAETERAGTRRAGPKGLAFFRTGQYAEALLAWEDAAEAGSTDAALFLGMMYDAGEGVPQSYSQALNWYRMAAEGGSVAGSFNLGAMRPRARGAPRSISRSFSKRATASRKIRRTPSNISVRRLGSASRQRAAILGNAGSRQPTMRTSRSTLFTSSRPTRQKAGAATLPKASRPLPVAAILRLNTIWLIVWSAGRPARSICAGLTHCMSGPRQPPRTPA